MTNFWESLPKPIFALAPMADVTDAPFREIITKYSKGKPGSVPFVLFTEFTSADGLNHPVAHQKLLRELYFTPAQKPIVAQLFTSRPEKMMAAAKLCQDLGFDGIDINMGCPDKNIEKQSCGAALIKNPQLSIELVQAAKAGAPNLPISVKTRLGYNKIEVDEWLLEIIKAEPAVLTVHLRTRKEMSKVAAHWELAPEVFGKIREAGFKGLLLGNGDVETLEDARQKTLESGADGVMMGRAIYGNPFLFGGEETTPKQKIEVLIEHINLFDQLLGDNDFNTKHFGGHPKSFAVMKKHFKAYLATVPNSNDLRLKLMDSTNATEVVALLTDFLTSQNLV